MDLYNGTVIDQWMGLSKVYQSLEGTRSRKIDVCFEDIIRYKYMNRMRMLSTIMGVLLTAVFLSSCGAPQVPTTKEEVPRISVEELKERIDSGEAIVIGDTRAQNEYSNRHIAGAISFPLSQVEENMNDLSHDQEIILYCT